MHESYQKRFKHGPDFRVKYKFKSYEDGGRRSLPFQGLRCDFSYFDEPDSHIYMVWPEFEDENGIIILENDKTVPAEGTASMWVVVPERRDIHKEKIKAGTKGFFTEGSHRTADCEVIEILDLFINPTK
jgi:hypothetical protein